MSRLPSVPGARAGALAGRLAGVLAGALAALAPAVASAHGLHAGGREVPDILLLGLAAAAGLGVARWTQRHRARRGEGRPDPGSAGHAASERPSSTPSDGSPSASRSLD